jgi:hypothetical protein
MNNCVVLLRVEKDRADTADGDDDETDDCEQVDDAARCAATPKGDDDPPVTKAWAVPTRASKSKARTDCMVILMVMMFKVSRGAIQVEVDGRSLRDGSKRDKDDDDDVEDKDEKSSSQRSSCRCRHAVYVWRSALFLNKRQWVSF